MSKSGKLYSNLWIRIAHDNFEKLVQIQKDYELKNVEEVFDLLVNTQTIRRWRKKQAILHMPDLQNSEQRHLDYINDFMLL